MTSPFSTPADDGPWLIRTDFTDHAMWERVGAAAAHDPDGFSDLTMTEAFVIVDDPRFDGLTPAGLLAFSPYAHRTYLLVDQMTMSHPEHPLLAVDAYEEPGTSFRLVPDAVQSFVVNRSIANLDFSDYADNLGPDGIHRGFGPPPEDVPPSAPAISTSDDAAVRLTELRQRAAAAAEWPESVAEDALQVGDDLADQWPQLARSAWQVAVDTGHIDLMPAAKFRIARSFSGLEVPAALAAYWIALRPWSGLIRDIERHLVDVVRSLDTDAVTGQLQAAFDADDPTGVQASVVDLADALAQQYPEAAGRLFELIIATGRPDAVPVAALQWGMRLQQSDPGRSRQLLQTVIDSGHPEHAPWAAFHLGQYLRFSEPTAAIATLQIAVDLDEPDVSPMAAHLLAITLWTGRDYDRAERAFLTAVASGHPQTGGAAGALAEMRAQGRGSVLAEGKPRRPPAPFTTSIVGNEYYRPRSRGSDDS